MKKILFALLIALMAQNASSQNFFDRIMNRMTFGVKAGANYSNFANKDFDTDAVAGFHVGGTMNYRISEGFSIQEDILYSTQGAKIKNSDFFEDNKINLSYLSIPILLRYRTSSGIYFEAGPQANMLLSDAKSTGFEDFADTIDAGAAAGLGYQFNSGSAKGLGMGIRYYRGFTDVGAFKSSSVKSNFNNTNAQLSLFYTF